MQRIFNWGKYALINEEFENEDVSWKQCISFGADNAAVMQGANAGVAAFVKEFNPSVFFIGCPCHLMKIVAQNWAKALKCQLDDLILDIFYYIEKSSKRNQGIKKCQEKFGVPLKTILKHVTWWLSLGHSGYH